MSAFEKNDRMGVVSRPWRRVLLIWGLSVPFFGWLILSATYDKLPAPGTLVAISVLNFFAVFLISNAILKRTNSRSAIEAPPGNAYPQKTADPKRWRLIVNATFFPLLLGTLLYDRLPPVIFAVLMTLVSAGVFLHVWSILKRPRL